MTKATQSILILFCLAASASASAVEINGTVQSASGETAAIVAEGDAAPRVGDKVEIFFKLPELDEEVAVATGKVSAADADGIQVKIESATGEVAKDQLVRIHSDQPQAKPAATKPPLVTTPPPPAPTSAETTSTSPASPAAKKSAKLITLNTQPTGALASGALEQYGLRFSNGKAAPKIFAAQPNMVMPAPCRKVLLVDGGPVTALTIKLDPPAKRFTLYRVGTANGASTPTWKMIAYNGNGKVLDSTGEIHGLPPRASSFSVAAEGIAQVDITTDNRNGAGTWATWNSLPIAGFGIDR